MLSIQVMKHTIKLIFNKDDTGLKSYKAVNKQIVIIVLNISRCYNM